MFGLCKISAQRIVSFGLKISELIWYKHKHASLLESGRILFEVSDNAKKEVFGEVRTLFKDGMQV